jgi:hypothetical protein
MSKLINVHVFNDLLDQLFEFLDESFTDYRSDIILAKTTLDMIRKSNYRLVVIQFKKYIEPYTKQINDCDENFFINFVNSNDQNQDFFLKSMKIKNIWLTPTTTKKQKAIIFYYFQQLLITSSKCNF